MQPLVSVVIPVFNAAETLEKSLTSALSQSVDVELIVIDGGSTDETLQIIQKYQSQIAHFVSERDKGVYDAMNKGAQLASGTFIYFLGADDQLHDSEVFQRSLADVRAFDIIAGVVRQLPPRHRRVPEWHRPLWNWKMNLRHTLHHQGVIYRRTILPKVPFDIRYAILADYALHLSLYRSRVRLHITDTHIADCGSEGISKTFNTNLYKEEWRIKKEQLPLMWKIFQLIWLPLKFLYKLV